MENYVPTSKVCEFLSVPREKVLRLIGERRYNGFPCYKIKYGPWRFKLSEVESWLREAKERGNVRKDARGINEKYDYQHMLAAISRYKELAV